jgi:hypothetical protein
MFHLSQPHFQVRSALCLRVAPLTVPQGIHSFPLVRYKGAPIPTKLSFLYVNVGRGHPFYLDGINDALIRKGSIGIVKASEDAAEAPGRLSRLGWAAVQSVYRYGSSPGPMQTLYRTIRSTNDYNCDSFAMKLLGRSIRATYAHDTAPIVVSHPLMVGILRGRANLFYQHGELVAPSESIVAGATTVFVPTDTVADSFQRGGYRDDQIVVSGLCIEPALVKQAAEARELRLQRYSANCPLTAAIYSSGAEPRQHIEAIALAAISLVKSGHHVVIFAESGRRLSKLIKSQFGSAGIALTKLDTTSLIPVDLPPAILVEYHSRREETTLTARLFPSFDFFIAPSHERSNWAVGLGLPMFILEPCIGPYAPLNRDLLNERGVAFDLTSQDHVVSVADRVNALRHRGELTKMSDNGWGKLPIDGFSKIADHLWSVCVD